MSSVANGPKSTRLPERNLKRSWRRFSRSTDGAAAIEFAILSIPYFIIVFAILETFVAFAAEQSITNAVNTLGRQLRIGQISGTVGHVNYKTEAQFRQLFCDEISIFIKCSAAELTSKNSKLIIDARSFTSFAEIPKTIPRKSSSAFADIDTASMKYAPGGPESINVLRAYYRWQVITDLVRPYITNIRKNGSMPTDFLIVATTTFKSEKY